MTAPPATAPAVAPALRLSGVSRTFGATVALDAVDLEVSPGEVHCVLGENGAGKSTLCNIVFGSLRPSSGSVERDGEPFTPSNPADAIASGVTMVHQHFSLLPNLTVRENLLLGRGGVRLDRAGLARRLAELEEAYGLAVDPDATTGALSVGARQQVEIVKALLPRPDLILFDEPTGVLGPAEIAGFLSTVRRIADAGTAVVLITHKLAEVTQVGDRATVLRGGRVVGGGPLSELTSDDLVTLMIGREVGGLDSVLAASLGLTSPEPVGSPAATTGAAAEAPEPAGSPVPAAGPAVLEVRDLVVDATDGARTVDHLDLAVPGGSIVGIAGVEGNGQSELVSVLSGALTASAGTVTLDGTDVTAAGPGPRAALGLGVIPEDRHHDAIVGELTVAQNLLLGRLDELRRFGMLDRRAMRRRAEDLVARYDVRTAGTDAPISSLSGGNQQKAVLARELSLDPLRCVVAAHPTRGLDLGAVDGVVRRLREAAASGVAVLVVSSELSELLALCDVVHVAYRGRLLGPVPTDDPTARDQVARLMTGAVA
ncbi:sugar ABC transporter ATP-binding protein [Paraoerskovia sediminicola]|uniref:Sugar ABC transporter ATP-binding protein n=1 Tax=Paraoerskovia sediminicola TaxID=1138587 RepID=A0ABN6XC95_9CELL|nr:ABC transporter ATP-binding protein [Paraoerskovia sediminicola]BDZ41400.1 sugar ABC transporter ATP-binding protein [Paraoerskovia sediminicola]